MAFKMKGPSLYRSPIRQNGDEMEREAALETEEMTKLAIERGWKYKMVEKPDGTRETIKVQVDKNGNEINE
jgi:hypothetical protein